MFRERGRQTNLWQKSWFLKGVPPGLIKPRSILLVYGTTKVVPFQNRTFTLG
jgi:hypothetical protein